MAYNPANRLRNIKEILAVYVNEKHSDLPDTRIVKQIFPKYGIHISYRTWMTIKAMKQKDLNV